MFPTLVVRNSVCRARISRTIIECCWALGFQLIYFPITFHDIWNRARYHLFSFGRPWVSLGGCVDSLEQTWSPRSRESIKKASPAGKSHSLWKCSGSPDPKNVSVWWWWWAVSWRVFSFFICLWSSKSFAPWSAAACAVQTQFIVFWCRLPQNVFVYTYWQHLGSFWTTCFAFCCFVAGSFVLWKRKEQGGANRRVVFDSDRGLMYIIFSLRGKVIFSVKPPLLV